MTSEESKPPSVPAAFSLAPYPSLAGRPIFSALFWLAPTGFRRFIRCCATSALQHHRIDAERSRFCARAGALAPHPLGMSVCPVVGGLSTPANASQRLCVLFCLVVEDLRNEWNEFQN